ncbi:OLC1v1009687C1 [Oldenlandia corymbosa var. corymbosa]|uniref:OLC1v1009687C1 n=1 Tax=Oldenlandia corymbosa var. corymbosa TaxID=529605 RepID=A0AAV1DPK5_OLDCO|nr:OLC1v1009687C1 [Oldenlandia corymbosa var. corymbosa]
MADDNINLIDAEGKSEINGYSSGAASEGKSSSHGIESAGLSEDHNVSSVSGQGAINRRRFSTGKPSPKARFEKIVPHYLRASTGSCHDFCKYGRKHAFEEKESRPWRKRIIKAQPTEQNSVGAVALGQGKKATVLKHTWPHMRQNPALAAPLGEKKKAKVVKEITSPRVAQNPAVIGPLGEKRKAEVVMEITLPQLTQNPAVIAPLGVRKKEIVHKEMTSPERKQNPLGTASLDAGKTARMRKQMASPDRKQNPPLMEKKKATVKPITSPDRISVLSHKASPTAIKSEGHREIFKKKVISPSKKVEASSEDLSSRKNSKVEKRMSKSSNQRSPVVHPPPVKPLSASHSLGSVKRTGKAEKTTKSVSPRNSPTVMRRTPMPKSSLYVRPSEEGSLVRGKGRDNVATTKNMVAAKASAKKVTALPIASSTSTVTKHVALKKKKKNISEPVPSLSDQHSTLKAEMGEPEDENVPEKTLHVIVTEEPESKLSGSTGDDKVVPPLSPESFPSPGSSSTSQSSSLSPTEDGDSKEKSEVEIENGEDVKEEIESGLEVEEIDESDSSDEQDEVEEEEEMEEGEEEDGEFSSEEGEEEDGEYLMEGEEEDLEGKDGHAHEEEVDEVIFDKGGKANNDIKGVVGNGGKTLRKGIVTAGSKDAIPVKIKFRRGRVVDLQSESSGPRRLRFRRARVMDENRDHTSEIKRRSFKKKGADGDESVPNPSDEKVVLRHQDAQGKKDAQGLFNNVIEETASKLVESRKSKVKALVGAFETVISLQDTKPSSQTVS